MALAGPLSAQERISHGRFQDVTLYRPQGEATEFVLFLSGDGGFREGVVGMAQALAQRGALVAGIDTARLLAALEADPAECVFPDGDLENLSHYVQGYAKLPTYHAPLLAGYSSGATLAYAMLAQAPPGTFAAGLSLGFCPDLALKKPLCKGSGVAATRRADGRGVDLAPVALGAPWIVLQGEQDRVCDVKAARDFVARVPHAELVALPEVGHGFAVAKSWLPKLLDADQRLRAGRAAALPPPPASLADLPLVEVPAARASDTFAVMLSGDGGWAGLDKQLAASLAGAGVPVAGLDSLRYFWSARTPAGLARDLDRVLRYYAARWRRQRALVIGYSQGADVLPFALNRLPAASRALVSLTVLLGIGERASFEFHLGNWIGKGSDGEPILPEVEKLEAARTLCIYGHEDTSLCPHIPAANVRAVVLPGGHHFDGNYASLARLIQERAGVH